MAINATLDNIGEWNGQEREAVELWNDHIAPVLSDLVGYQGINYPDDMAAISVHPATDRNPGIGAPADDWAWDEFCVRLGRVDDITTDEAMAIVVSLALELRKRGE